MPLFHNSASQSTPANYENITEIAASAPVVQERARRENEPECRVSRSRGSHHAEVATSSDSPSQGYQIPDSFANLNELGASSPVENIDEAPQYRTVFLEDTRSHEQEYENDLERQRSRRRSRADTDENRNVILETSSPESEEITPDKSQRVSKLKTTFYTISYLILFSFLGTLARQGLDTLTAYPGAPITINSLWANFSGSLFMGFLSEDRNLFKYHHPSRGGNESEKRDSPASNGSIHEGPDEEAAKKAHMALKKTIPLYIGLTTGFCGSFTSFSAFIRDTFFQLSNTAYALSNSSPTASRNGGYSFMALLAVIIITVCLSLSALQIGGHLAISIGRFIPGLPRFLTRKVLDRCTVFLAWGLWLGAILMAIWPPDRPSGPAGGGRTSWAQETWRGQAIFSMVFAPLGTLLRFYAAIYMNGIFVGFPLGTFVVNVFGTIVLGMSWDLQRAPLGSTIAVGGGIIGCQVLEGIQDGFCGCITTVSTWVLELTSLKRRHAYLYGLTSVCLSLAFLIVIMGTLEWTKGFSPPTCVL